MSDANPPRLFSDAVYLQALRVALASSDWDSPVTNRREQAAFALAEAIGECRLVGVEVEPSLDGSLATADSLAALRELSRRLARWIEHAKALPQKWDGCESFEADQCCCEVLEGLWKSWAVMVAVDEALQAAWELAPHEAEQLQSALRGVDDFRDALDREALNQVSYLATIADLPLLNNWRTALTSPYSESLPWWLDGAIEEVAAQQDREALSLLPRADFVHDKTANTNESPLVRARDLPEVPAYDWLPAKEETSLALAAAGGSAVPQWTELSWHSADGKYQALLMLPHPLQQGEETMVKVLFFRADGEIATELNGALVVLAGVAGTIDVEGAVEFRIGDLRQPQQEPNLLVGKPAMPWARSR